MNKKARSILLIFSRSGWRSRGFFAANRPHARFLKRLEFKNVFNKMQLIFYIFLKLPQLASFGQPMGSSAIPPEPNF
jgi:hypothetical protein